jgi:hypothetical protein
VVELSKSVHEKLPVRCDIRAVAESRSHSFEWVALQGGHHWPKELDERLVWFFGHVHEYETRPDLAVHGHQTVETLVEIEELTLLLDERELALEVVTPPMVLAGELAAHTAGFFSWIVVPDELVSSMTADVVEGPDFLVLATDDDDRCIDNSELLGEVASHSGQLLDPTHVEPGTLEDGLAFPLIELRRR